MKKLAKVFYIGLIMILLLVAVAFILAKDNSKFRKIIYMAGKSFKDEIYREATLNNPKGDVIPDQLDDAILKEIKKQM